MGSNLKTLKIQVRILASMIAIIALLAMGISYIKNSMTAKKIGYISSVYEKDGKRYLNLDEVKFLTGNEAVEAAKKDGNAEYEDGKYFVYDDYYIVNSSKQKKPYVISDTASFEILSYIVDPYHGGADNVPVSYEKFKNAVSKDGDLLCYIFTENDVIVKIEGQYVP